MQPEEASQRKLRWVAKSTVPKKEMEDAAQSRDLWQTRASEKRWLRGEEAQEDSSL